MSDPIPAKAELLDLAALRFGVVLNTASGSCDASAERAVEETLQEAGIRPVRILCGGGGDVDRSLQEVISERVDVLVVVGGDGTIRSAAERVGSDGPLLMPLPGGTMNMLPKTLYGQRSWRDALRDTLAAPTIQPVHGGEVCGHRFFVAAIFGEPTRFAGAREALREGDLGGAIGKGVEAVRRAVSTEIGYRFSERVEGTAEAVAVLCPLVSLALSDEDEVLEAAAIDVDGPLDALRLAIASAFSRWRDDATVTRARVTEFEISGEDGVPALLDGEAFKLPERATVRLVRSAFRALRPADEETRTPG